LNPKEHLHTLIWIHGLAHHQEHYIMDVYNALGDYRDKTKILCPRAPDR